MPTAKSYCSRINLTQLNEIKSLILRAMCWSYSLVVNYLNCCEIHNNNLFFISCEITQNGFNSIKKVHTYQAIHAVVCSINF